MMKEFNIPISKPSLTDVDFQEIKKCFDSSWISFKSPWVERFEKEFAKKVSKTKYAVAVNSGTSALFLALKVLKIGPGDEVIIPTLTMIATVNAISWVGATPVLVDSTTTNSWNINVKKIEEKINSTTKAILPVHIYGYPSNMKKIIEIAQKHRLYVIEDAAEAMGAQFEGKNIGSFGDLSCFSLYVNKLITTGNGGMVCTNNKHYYKLLKKLVFFDFNEKKHFKHSLIGYNLVLTGLQAALGISQLKRFNIHLKKRKLVYQWYSKRLSISNKIKLLKPDISSRPNYWFPVIILDSKKAKNRVEESLIKNGIEPREFFLPVHLQPAYKKQYKDQSYPAAEFYYKHGLLLPSYFDISQADVNRVCEVIFSHL